ncbi:DUF4169 family protein [Maricaulis sp. CAU 1757]
MSAKPVNLRQYRKQKARADKARAAAANRVAHGMPKAARELAEAQRLKVQKELEAKRREPAGDAAGSVGDPGRPPATETDG